MERSIFENKTILIVDDYAINCELLSLVVEDAGANSLMASNGLECVNIIKQQHVDMILMDSNMPVMNGIDATKEVRTLPQGKDIVIIGITLYEDENEAKNSLEAGMDLLCPKLALNDEKLIEIGKRFFSNNQQTTTVTHNDEIPHSQPVLEPVANSIGTENVIMDYSKALQEFENDEDLLRSLIIDFNKIIHAQLSVMQQALQSADYTCIQQEAHGIKGGAANLNALPLSSAANLLEMACRKQSDVTTISDLLNKLAENMESFQDYVLKN